MNESDERAYAGLNVLDMSQGIARPYCGAWSRRCNSSPAIARKPASFLALQPTVEHGLRLRARRLRCSTW